MYTGCHCPVTAGQKGGGVWEMDIRDPPWAQANFPPPQFVVSARSIIVKNVLMPTLVGNKLFIRQYMMDTH